MAVATGKSRRGVDHELEALAVGHRFVATRSADDAKAKPDPEMIEQILAEVEVPAEHAVMVGDSPLDLAMGAGAGVACYGVLGGVGSLEALLEKKPRRVLLSIAELREALRHWP